MKLISTTLITKWQNIQRQLLEDSGDSVVIHYNEDYSGTTGDTSGYNEMFNAPSDLMEVDYAPSGTFTEPATVTISGRIHTDLYGLSVARAEEIQRLAIGYFEPGDILFTCLLEDALLVDDIIASGTVFDNTKFVNASKTGKNYKVKKTGVRGFEDPYVLDVFMELTNE